MKSLFTETLGIMDKEGNVLDVKRRDESERLRELIAEVTKNCWVKFDYMEVAIKRFKEYIKNKEAR